jgi:hypothetical protein
MGLARVPALALTLALGCCVAASDSGASEVRVHGAELRIEHGEKTLRGTELIGVELALDGIGMLRIDAAEQDAAARSADVWLYQARLRAEGADTFEPFCAPDPSGDTRLMVFQGELDADQHYIDDPQRFSLSCVSGVQAKCVRWGYAPWRQAPFGGASLRPYFEACLRLARADHCGDGVTGTVDGNLIDVYDRVGVQAPEADPGELSFEAGWDESGAVCVHHMRIAQGRPLDALARDCPRLREQDLGSACDEAGAARRGALLFTRSRAPLSR